MKPGGSLQHFRVVYPLAKLPGLSDFVSWGDWLGDGDYLFGHDSYHTETPLFYLPDKPEDTSTDISDTAYSKTDDPF